MSRAVRNITLLVLLVLSLSASAQSNQKMIGTKAKEIVLRNPNNDTIRLSDLKGKVVLIDFWASWCGPCKMTTPQIRRLYKKYHEFGFEIFSISQDENRSNWTRAIKRDSLNWKYHGFDFENQFKTSNDYNAFGLPTFFLVNEKGIITEVSHDTYLIEEMLHWQFFEQIYAFPRKTTGELKLTEKTKFKIYNSANKLVVRGKSKEVDLSELKNGIYYIEYDGKRESIIKKSPNSKAVTFFPQMVSDKITLSEEASYEIYNSRGKRLKKGSAKEIDVSELKLKKNSVNYISIEGDLFEFIKK